MTAIADLPREQRAVLSLVLGKGRSYTQIATMLQVDEEAVRERAHKALGEIGPRDGTPPPAQRQVEVGDYLLGQQSAQQADETREYLEDSAVGRAWARGLAAELRFVAAAELPEIPTDSGSAPPPPRLRRAPTRQARTAGGEQPRPAVSRKGGAILLGALAAIAVLVLILTSGGGSSKKSPATAATKAAPAPQTKVLGRIDLTTPNRSGAAVGVATLLQQGTTQGIALQVTGLPPTTTKFAYAVWLYNTHKNAQRIGFAPPVKADGKLGAVAQTPANIATYRALIVTRETTARPTQPGTIVLSGPLPKRP